MVSVAINDEVTVAHGLEAAAVADDATPRMTALALWSVCLPRFSIIEAGWPERLSNGGALHSEQS